MVIHVIMIKNYFNVNSTYILVKSFCHTTFNFAHIVSGYLLNDSVFQNTTLYKIR